MHSNVFQITSKIVALARSSRISCARKLFDKMPHRDLVAWNAMLTSYSQLGLYRNSLSIFHHMRIANTRPDHFSFTATLSACAGLGEVRNGMMVHALVVVSGYQSSLPVNNSIIDMYGKCLNPRCAGKVFEEMDNSNEVTWCALLFAYVNSSMFDIAREVFHVMPERVEIAWNIMITGHARSGEIELCLLLFREMQESLWLPDHCTFSALMNSCCESYEILCGCMVHGLIIKTGWYSAVEIKNSILSFYAKLGNQNDALKVFESIGKRTLVSWNAIIDIHMKMGDINKALIVFRNSPEKNVISWTSMITGYARNGHSELALSFFVDMIRNNLPPDDFTFGAALHACSCLAVLGHGRMIHCSIFHCGFHAYAYVGNGLVNMYAKCGDIEGSSRAFNDILDKDLVSWNAMLFGFGMHGLARQALQLYEDMVESGTKPDKLTFLGLLVTCSHSGLIEKGRMFFELMESAYGLPHEMDHVACMVDMFGRGGCLAEARELASKYLEMGAAKTISSEALLGASSVCGDVEIGTYFGEELKVLDPQKEMSYVLLSNLYCASEQWKEAEMIRKQMVNQGIKKMPGCSWVEMRNNVTVFVAGNQSQPYIEELCKILCYLEFEMRNPCFIGFEIEEIQKVCR